MTGSFTVARAPMLVGDVLDWFADPTSWEGENGIVNRLIEHARARMPFAVRADDVPGRCLRRGTSSR